MRLCLVALVIAVGWAPACRRDRPVEVVTLPGGATFEVPAGSRPSGNARSDDERSFVVRGNALLEVVREPTDEDCLARLAWVEDQTRDEVERGEVEVDGSIDRMTLGGRQAIRANLVTADSRVLEQHRTRTEMIGMCGEGEFVIFQVGYRGERDDKLSRLLTDAAKSLRY